MINRTITNKKTEASISFASNKKNETYNKNREFKGMKIIDDGNKSIVDKWQKFEVYPFCD